MPAQSKVHVIVGVEMKEVQVSDVTKEEEISAKEVDEVVHQAKEEQAVVVMIAVQEELEEDEIAVAQEVRVVDDQAAVADQGEEIARVVEQAAVAAENRNKY